MDHSWPKFEFLQPECLYAFVVLPLILWAFVRSLVDLPKRQMWASLMVRLVILTLLIMSLAGLNLRSATREVFVVFAVDESLSVGETGAAFARQFIAEATASETSDRFAEISFARTPKLANDNLQESNDDVDDSDWASQTNMQSAIEIALAAIPAEFVPHVVLLSDGNETVGNAMAATAASGRRISTVPLDTRTQPELQVSAVNVPYEVADGSPFSVEVVVDANHEDEAIIEVFRGDYRIQAERVFLSIGENRFTFPDQVDRPAQYTARISRPQDGLDQEAFRDTLLDNNSASGLVYTSGKPRLLLIERFPETAQPLQWALSEEGIHVDVRPPQAVPEALNELQDYDVVALSNIPANELSLPQMDVLRTFVRDVGGGLIMLGGDESFGLGGYYKTIIEDVLPVRSDFEKEKEKPGLAMVLVIDKSGSMGGQKLELAKDAARGTVELLGEKDQIGVIAFDGMPYWVSPMTSASQKSTVIDRIAAIELGGGTTLYPAMQEAFRALQAVSAKLKHVIILTDGHSTPGDFEGIAQDMAALRMTVSTVGLGEVDEALLKRISEIGNGRNYLCSDATSVPQIFAKETITASKSAINEDPFLPLLTRATPVLDGIDFDEAPFLLGYVVTQAKPTSEVILVHPETQAPILSWWRYGLGISVAFTSDARSRWAADWLSWDGYNKLWAQTVRHCLKKKADQGMTFSVERRGETATVVIDSLGPSGQFLNEATTRLTIIDPALKSASMLVPQTAPGRYSIEFPMSKPGAWNTQVTQSVEGEVVHQQSRGAVVGYPDELRIRNVNETSLRSIASLSGGQYQPSPDSVFKPLPSESADSTTPLRTWLLSMAALLLIADVALRRLDMSAVFGAEVYRGSMRQ